MKTTKAAALLFAVLFLAFGSASAVDWSNYEYSWQSGLHQEEWYDPSDWFDDQGGVSWETDWSDYYYSAADPYDYGSISTYYGSDQARWTPPGEQSGNQFMNKIKGSIQSMQTRTLQDQDEQHVIAQIQTQDGQTFRVDLGSQSELSGINLQQGDQVTVYGVNAEVASQDTFMAFRVESGDSSVMISRAHDAPVANEDVYGYYATPGVYGGYGYDYGYEPWWGYGYGYDYYDYDWYDNTDPFAF